MVHLTTTRHAWNAASAGHVHTLVELRDSHRTAVLDRCIKHVHNMLLIVVLEWTQRLSCSRDGTGMRRPLDGSTRPDELPLHVVLGPLLVALGCGG